MSQNKPNLRNKISSYFGIPMINTPWNLYLASMNESGKITARSILDLMTIVFETLEEMEKKEE